MFLCLFDQASLGSHIIMQTVILYNEHEVRQGGNKDDIRRGYNLWIDITDPSPPEILALQKNFDLDTKTLEIFIHKSKKPQVRVLDGYTFTLILDLKYKSFGTLMTEAVYIFSVEEGGLSLFILLKLI